jgi:hypothetical protein
LLHLSHLILTLRVFIDGDTDLLGETDLLGDRDFFFGETDLLGDRDFFFGDTDLLGDRDFFFGETDLLGDRDFFFGDRDFFVFPSHNPVILFLLVPLGHFFNFPVFTFFFGDSDFFFGDSDFFFGDRDFFFGDRDFFFGDRDDFFFGDEGLLGISMPEFKIIILKSLALKLFICFPDGFKLFCSMYLK